MTERIPPSSSAAAAARERILALQSRFVSGLEGLSDPASEFQASSWLRDEGRHGGGTRLGVQNDPALNRASINFSEVHYDDDPKKALASASALSCIVHPLSLIHI